MNKLVATLAFALAALAIGMAIPGYKISISETNAKACDLANCDD